MVYVLTPMIMPALPAPKPIVINAACQSVLLAKLNLGRQAFTGILLALALTGVLFCTGCGKKKPTAAGPTPAEVAATSAVTHEPVFAPKSVAIAPVVTPSGEPDMGELNRCLLRWVLGHRKKPDTFEEFAASANVPIPPAPAGKKYVIDKSMHIVLAKK